MAARVSTRNIRSKVTRLAVKLNLRTAKLADMSSPYSEKLEDNTIVICDPFFRPDREHFEPLLAKLQNHKSYQKDPHRLLGKTRMLVHKITHLAAISEAPTELRMLKVNGALIELEVLNRSTARKLCMMCWIHVAARTG